MIQSSKAMRYRRYKKRIRLQFKRWMKYSWSDQEKILSKYNIILLGHRTRKEKLKALFKKSNRERNAFDTFDKYLRMVSKGISLFSKEMNKFSFDEKQTNKNVKRTCKGLEKAIGVDSANRYARLSGSSKKDYSGLVGSSNRNYSALTSRSYNKVRI